jgi:hypothetical protein
VTGEVVGIVEAVVVNPDERPGRAKPKCSL